MKQILVVDDSPTIRRMVRASLARFFPTIEFLEAGSGLEAIERLALAPIGLIVLDLNMPDMHGLEVLQFVRSHEKYRQVPIAVLTTRGDEGSRAAAMRAGASVYLTKPFSPDVLAGEVRKLFTDDELASTR
jgi:two-component system, chemotaxis family, chemotaxis protein CheY